MAAPASRTLLAHATDDRDMRWPSADASASLDYSMDFAAIGIDIVTSVSWSVSPPAELTPSGAVFAGSVATCTLSGGTPGRDYAVKIRVATASQTHERNALFFTELSRGHFPSVPVSRGFGTPVVWFAAQRLALNLRRPLSAATFAVV